MSSDFITSSILEPRTAAWQDPTTSFSLAPSETEGKTETVGQIVTQLTAGLVEKVSGRSGLIDLQKHDSGEMSKQYVTSGTH